MPKIKAVEQYKKDGDGWQETRYVIIDEETGDDLDDAQGYGYRTKQKAMAAWNYKNRERSKDVEKAAKEREVAAWMKENKSFVNNMDATAFEIAKGSWGPEEKFDTAFLKKMLKDEGYDNLPFTAFELLKYWKNGPNFSKEKKR